MNAYTVRRVVAACAVAGSFLLVPAESQAIFHWFGGGGCCGGGGTTAYRPYTATYAPYVAAYPAAPSCNTCYSPAPACNTCYSPAPACNTCSPCQQTCNYVPQTCYRTVYQQVPVTACQPVSGCDSCGNQVTAMRPVVTYQTQARLVPYTTYRQVYTPTVSYAPAPVSCATGNCGRSNCSTCGTTSSTPAYTNPAPNYAPAPITQGVPGSAPPSLAPPLTPPAAETQVPQTFRDDSGVTDPESRLRVTPEASHQNSFESSNRSTNSTLTPRLLNSDDRTTYRPMKRSVTVIPVAAEEDVDNDGWRAARR